MGTSPCLLTRIIMGAIEDYINGLEGQENPDLQKVVSDLLGLHNQEMETREAKISSLNDEVAQGKTLIANRDVEITKWKAQNFDLAMQASGENRQKPRVEGEPIAGDSIRISDLFTPEIRKRHFNGH